jgi:hypothetical protein
VTAELNPRFTLVQRLLLAVVPRVVWALLWVLGRTWCFEVIAEEGVVPIVFGEKSPAEIFCFWHQCVLPCTIYFRRSRAVILISRSFDGELVTRVLKMFGFDAVRGSSTRGGREGLLGLAHMIESGPIYQAKMGPIKLAQMTGAPIGVFHLEPERAWTMRSWDRFLIPKPFTRICVSWAKGTQVPADLSAAEFEPKRKELNAALERARLRALEYFKKAKE